MEVFILPARLYCKREVDDTSNTCPGFGATSLNEAAQHSLCQVAGPCQQH